MEDDIMIDRAELTTWWRRELLREFTKLECGLLGALFTAIVIILAMITRFEAG
jgi:hypothetical protein